MDAETRLLIEQLIAKWRERGQQGTRSTVEAVEIAAHAEAFYYCADELDALLQSIQQAEATHGR
jgi:hypothetical protein